jgi:hypothetical protein
MVATGLANAVRTSERQPGGPAGVVGARAAGLVKCCLGLEMKPKLLVQIRVESARAQPERSSILSRMTERMNVLRMRSAEEECHRARQPFPGGLFVLQPPPAGGGQTIEASAAVVLGRSPVGGDPPLPFEPLQRRIQRPLLHLQDIIRQLADALSDRPAVQRFECDGFQDQQVECALQQVGRFSHVGGFPLTIYKSGIVSCR